MEKVKVKMLVSEAGLEIGEVKAVPEKTAKELILYGKAELAGEEQKPKKTTKKEAK